MRKERLCENLSAISRHNRMSAVIKQNGNRYLGHKIYEFLNSKFCPHECSQNISILKRVQKNQYAMNTATITFG